MDCRVTLIAKKVYLKFALSRVFCEICRGEDGGGMKSFMLLES